VEVLETMVTPEARQVLDLIAQGPQHATLTREAQEVLRRLRKP
jgi:hypothetical protein